MRLVSCSRRNSAAGTTGPIEFFSGLSVTSFVSGEVRRRLGAERAASRIPQRRGRNAALNDRVS